MIMLWRSCYSEVFLLPAIWARRLQHLVIKRAHGSCTSSTATWQGYMHDENKLIKKKYKAHKPAETFNLWSVSAVSMSVESLLY